MLQATRLLHTYSTQASKIIWTAAGKSWTKLADSAHNASQMSDFALHICFHCGFWKSTWASPHDGRWRNNHTPTEGCKLHLVGPNITVILGMVAARSLVCFRWICNVQSKVFQGHGQRNCCPALHHPLCIHREVGWPLIAKRGIQLDFFVGYTNKTLSCIIQQKYTCKVSFILVYTSWILPLGYHRPFLNLVTKQQKLYLFKSQALWPWHHRHNAWSGLKPSNVTRTWKINNNWLIFTCLFEKVSSDWL